MTMTRSSLTAHVITATVLIVLVIAAGWLPVAIMITLLLAVDSLTRMES